MAYDNLPNQQNSVEEKGISLKDIFHIIKKHWIAISVFILAGFGAGLGYSFVETKEYVANASLIAMPDAIKTTTAAEYNGMSMIAETFVSFVSENVVINQVQKNIAEIKDTNNEPVYGTVSYKAIRSGMSVSNKNLIIKVSYYSPDPQKSIDFTNAIVDAVVQVANSTTNGVTNYKLLAGNLQSLSFAETAGLNSHRTKDALIGLAAGLVIAVIYTFLYELFDNSFKDEQEVERELGLPVLAVIPFYDIDKETAKKGGNN